jgi:hypothetical protein
MAPNEIKKNPRGIKSHQYPFEKIIGNAAEKDKILVNKLSFLKINS